MGNFGTKPKPKADTNVPNRPSGNIHCTLSLSTPFHAAFPLPAAVPLACLLSWTMYVSVSVSVSVSPSEPLPFLLCVCSVLQHTCACHLPLGRRVGGAVKASVLKGPVSVLSTWESSIQLDTSITSFWGKDSCPWLSVFWAYFFPLLIILFLGCVRECTSPCHSVSDTNCDDLSTPTAPTASISCGIKLLLGP